ncbi:MAG: hypothetical protein PHG96_07120, partial [Kiritimatiellae bacterium]|nr:hypothetical protein [Kiritimatiellia bacterium]
MLTLFSRYDFTVDENDPNDSDVALDPELLGKVFENLLGAYNPETREIVNYMVDESLVAYLMTQCEAGIPACPQGVAGFPACPQGVAGIPACPQGVAGIPACPQGVAGIPACPQGVAGIPA